MLVFVTIMATKKLDYTWVDLLHGLPKSHESLASDDKME